MHRTPRATLALVLSLAMGSCGNPPDAADASGCPPGHLCGSTCAELDYDPSNCGACGNVCPWSATCSHGTCLCLGSTPAVCEGTCRDLYADPMNCGACDVTCSNVQMCDAGTCIVPPPRPIAPLSTTRVSSQLPTLRWSRPGGHVEICAERSCTHVEQRLDSVGSSVTLESPLEHRVHFWHVRALDGETYGPTWEFWVGARSAGHDTSWGSVLDSNGDGFADVALNGSRTSNLAFVFLGGVRGLNIDPLTVHGPVLSTSNGALIPGFVVANAGDVDGDGFGDLLGLGIETLGEWRDGILIYRGGFDGPAPTANASTFPGEDFGYGFAAGDINGDGYGDVVIGSGIRSCIRVFVGDGTGFVRPAWEVTADTPDMDISSIAGDCDINSDGFADLILGATGLYGATGRVSAYFGSSAGPVMSGWAVNGSPGEQLGARVACAGDVNGDGFADVLATGADERVARVFLGSVAGLRSEGATLDGPQGCTSVESIAGAHDLNGDGYDDVALGAGGANTVTVYFGSADGIGTAPFALPALVRDARSAWAFGPGDVEGDGHDDIVFGSGTTAYLLGGTDAGPAGSPLQLR